MSEPGLRADLVGVRPGQLLFVDFHVADSYRLARAMLRDASSATDVVADAFVIFLWGSLTGVEGNRGLVGVVYRRCLEIRAIARASPREASDTEHRHGAPIDDDLWSWLPPTIADVVALATFGGRSVDEIASLTGLSPAEVRCRLAVALAVARSMGGERGHACESRSVKRPLPVLAGSVK